MIRRDLARLIACRLRDSKCRDDRTVDLGMFWPSDWCEIIAALRGEPNAAFTTGGGYYGGGDGGGVGCGGGAMDIVEFRTTGGDQYTLTGGGVGSFPSVGGAGDPRPCPGSEPNAAGQESVRIQNPGSESLPSEPAPAAPEPLPERVQQEIRRYSTFGSIREDMEYIARFAIACERERVLRIRRRYAVPQPEHDDERLDDPRRGQAAEINRRRE